MQHVINRLPRQHKIVILALAAMLVLLILLPSDQASASRATAHANDLELGKRYQLELQLAATEQQAADNSDLRWINYEVKSGDNLALIFQQLGFSPQELHRLTRAEDAAILRRIHPGDILSFAQDANDTLIHLSYELNELETLLISRQADGVFSSQRESRDVEIRTGFANATISTSFWNAGVQAGLTQGQIMGLADLFGWDIDFALDIRPGDQFSVLYEQRYIDGEFVGYGRIIAAEFINQGETFRTVRHDNGNYYTPEGRNMRKTFLRAPVSFQYISSNFNPRRIHPVTGRVAAHNGIDYVAPVGSPVQAAGDGRVVRSGYNNLNGHYVFIQHGERYVTKYLHLSRRLVQQGTRVRQGQRIGLVGATGRVTGAHLHYEFLVDGVHRNPRTVNLPQAESLPRDQLPAFRTLAERQLAHLDHQKRLYLAMND